MNAKSILGILLVILALSLTLGVVSAEEVTADDASADILSVEESAAVEEVAVGANEAPASEATNDVNDVPVSEPAETSNSSDVQVSDVGVEVTPLYDFGEINTWSVFVYNNGPDTALNTVVFLGSSDNLVYYDHFAYSGEFDYVNGIWYVGDLPANDYTELLLAMEKIAPGPCFIEAAVDCASVDPNPSNNYDIAYMGVGQSASASEETLPAAGNPIIMALLALFVVGVGGLKRKL